MFKRNRLWLHLSFWTILTLAVTAEGWMDLLCQGVLGL